MQGHGSVQDNAVPRRTVQDISRQFRTVQDAVEQCRSAQDNVGQWRTLQGSTSKEKYVWWCEFWVGTSTPHPNPCLSPFNIIISWLIFRWKMQYWYLLELSTKGVISLPVRKPFFEDVTLNPSSSDTNWKSKVKLLTFLRIKPLKFALR